MGLPEHVFREYDVRGVADRDLTDGFIDALGRAFVSIVRERSPKETTPRIALCRDGRVSSPRIHAALSEAFLAAGADVVDVGIGPTPLLYFAAHYLGADASVQITGSHNPGEDNGLKMMRGTASFFGDDIVLLKQRIATAAQAARRGTRSEVDVCDAYIDALRGASRLDASGLHIVVDAGNGAGGPLGVRTLRALGVEVDALHAEIDGRFPNHHPDPTVLENLIDLRDRVLATGAQVGVAWDGDGDRIGVIDERGDVIWGDKLMILFSRAILREHPGATVLGEVKCSQALFDDVAARGGRALYSKTGHSLIKTRMKAEGALLAGEMSGHVFFADRYFGYDDAIYATVRLLEIVAAARAEGRVVSSLLADLPRTFATPEIRVPCPDARKFEVVARVTEHFRKSHTILDLDGARIDFQDGAWGLCRASNTGPIVVLRFEARSESRLAEIEREVRAVLEQSDAAVGRAS